MQYQYKAKDKNGTSVDGRMEGDTELSVRIRLKSQGMFPMVVVPIGRVRATSEREPKSFPLTDLVKQPNSSWLKLNSRVRRSDLIVVFSQLSIMCQSGDDLAESLKSVASQCTQPRLQNALLATYSDVQQGSKFSTALAKHPKIFNESITAALAAGEHAGRIVEVLDRLTRLMRKDEQLSSSIAGMMMYPLVLCGITSVVIVAMFFFVLPQFATIFRDSDRPVPPLTELLLSMGAFLRGYALWILLAAATLVSMGVYVRNQPKVKRTLDYWTLHAGFLKKPVRALMAGRIFRLLGTMLENDVPLLQSIQLVRKSCRNVLFQEMFAKIESEILQGEGMKETLISTSFLPPGSAHMVSTGEKTGKLASVLQSIGEYFEEEGERTLRSVVKLMEPAIIVCLGVVVGTVVMSIVLPLLDITTLS